MSVIVEKVGEHRRRTPGLWRSRSAGIYFVALGGLQLIALGLVLSRNSDLAASLAPWWFYAAGFMYPISRTAAGVALLWRSRLAVPILGFFAICAGVALFGGSAIWRSQTGMPLEVSQMYVVFARLDFLLVLIALVATFKWKASGLLK
jgi:hypothetical protein